MTTRRPKGSAGRASSPSDGADRIDRRVTSRRDAAREIAEPERIQQELLAREALLHALTDNSPDAIYVKDTQSRWLMANPAVLRIVGLDAQQALGKTDLELYADPEIGKAILENDRRILQGKSAETFEEWADTPDGRRLFLSTKAPWFDGQGNVAGLIGISHDITERRRAEAALRVSEDKFSKAFRNSPNAITITRLSDGKIIEGNESAYELFGYSHDEVIGKTTADLEIWADPGDRQRLVNGLGSRGFIRNEEFVLQRKDKSRVFVNLSASLITFDDQKCFLSSFVDITERKRAEEALRESQRQSEVFASMLRSSKQPLGSGYPDGRLGVVNHAFEELIGYSEEELRSINWQDMTPPEWLEKEKALMAELERTGVPVRYEKEFIRKDGRRVPVELFCHLVRDKEGKPEYYYSFVTDLTERRRAEQALRNSQREFKSLAETVPGVLQKFDRHFRVAWLSPAAKKFTGIPAENFIGKTNREMGMPADLCDLWEEAMRDVVSTGSIREVEFSLMTPEGAKTFLLRLAPEYGADGKDVEYILGVSTDITSRKRAEEELRQSRNQFQVLTQNVDAGVALVDEHGRFAVVNPAFLRLFDLPGDSDIMNVNDRDWSQWQVFDENGNLLDVDEHPVRKAAATGLPVRDRLISVRTPKGNLRWMVVSAEPTLGEDGRREAVICTYHDITELKTGQELSRALAEQAKLRLGAAVEQASDSVVMVDLDGTIRYVNAAFESINKRPRGEAVGTPYFDLLAGEPSAAAGIREAIAEGRPWHGPLIRIVRDARAVELEVTASPAKDPSGAVIGGLITEKDVTRENALQNQVRQAQKMEALGTLAGGITHDFNNILGTIVLNTELALLDLDPASPARRSLPLVLQAASRGKELAKQIITFSRQRKWEKKPVGIAAIIKEGLGFLKTTLPKNVLIQETIDAQSGVVMADPSHINQVLVNLCQNSALAMADGGRLEVKLAPVEVDEAMVLRYPNLRPGPHVRLTVSDTGCGMTKDVQERIFEPFFTTRLTGAGSGLGLAVVHGIVRTYDGEIVVASEPGKGSTFDVYFPRLDHEGPEAGVEKKDGPWKGEARVLLVEDEAAQRKSLSQGLGHLGYKVTAWADGRLALGAFRKDPSAFDVVITDQIMPRMTGLELASAITAIRLDLPVILCTGFSEKVNETNIVQSGVRELLMKPFTLVEVTGLIRKVLG